MIIPSFTKIVLLLFLVYICHTLYAIYLIFKPPSCSDESNCIRYFLKNDPELQLVVFTSVSQRPTFSSDVTFIGKISNFDYLNTVEKTLNLSLTEETRRNGTLHIHVFVAPKQYRIKKWSDATSLPDFSYADFPLTEYQYPVTSTFQLLSGEKEEGLRETVSHLKSEVGLRMLTGIDSFPTTNIPSDLYKLFRVSRTIKTILPIVKFDSLNDRSRYLKEIGNNSFMEVKLVYSPINIGKLRLMLNIESQFDFLQNMGFSKKDLDEVKGIFSDTNVYFLCLTIFVSTTHLLLDTLAFKNDISFWRNCKSTVGLSLRSVLWRAFSQAVIFLYLLDENTSLLVLLPAGVGTLIEFWKVHKVIPFDWKRFKLQNKKLTNEEKSTREYDAEGMRYLSYLLYPLMVAAAIYSLLYLEHRSWYSWIIQSLVNCVYGFGFLFMLPQLFINYKLKSVAHLPWKAFMYKAFNTFIDDIFAFIIHMPTAHRLACFRDDIVFVVYLYQRWLYPVDSSRTDDTIPAALADKKND